jgi:hypothetical protein
VDVIDSAVLEPVNVLRRFPRPPNPKHSFCKYWNDEVILEPDLIEEKQNRAENRRFVVVALKCGHEINVANDSARCRHDFFATKGSCAANEMRVFCQELM